MLSDFHRVAFRILGKPFDVLPQARIFWDRKEGHPGYNDFYLDDEDRRRLGLFVREYLGLTLDDWNHAGEWRQAKWMRRAWWVSVQSKLVADAIALSQAEAK